MFDDIPIELIENVIKVLFVIGVLAALWSFLCLWFRELRALKSVEAQAGLSDGPGAEQMDLPQLNSLLAEKKLRKTTIIHERLMDIQKALAGGEKQRVAPHLHDLHRMSTQTMLSRMAPTCIRIISSVLLICGICGTLYGVSSAVGDPNAMLDKLPTVLGPSKLAVLYTIILLVLRGAYEALLERFVCRVDRLTLTRILPNLQPKNIIEGALNNFSQNIQSFTEVVKNYKDSAEAMRHFAEDFSQKSQDYLQLGSSLQEALLSINANEGEMKAHHGKLAELAQNSEALLTDLRDSARALHDNRAQIARHMENLQKEMDNLQNTTGETDKVAKLMTNLQTTVQTASEKLGVLDGLQKSADTLEASLKETREGMDTEERRRQESFNQVESQLASYEGRLQEMELQSQSVQDTVSLTAQSVGELVASGDAFKQSLESLRQQTDAATAESARILGEVDQESGEMVTRIKSTADSARRIAKTLRKIAGS